LFKVDIDSEEYPDLFYLIESIKAKYYFINIILHQHLDQHVPSDVITFVLREYCVDFYPY